MNNFIRQMMAERVFIVTGPPGAGKTTYCKQNRQPGDIVVDLDYISAALILSEGLQTDNREVLSTAIAIRDFLIDQIGQNRLTFGRAFIVTTKNAEKIREKTGGKIVTIDPGIEETLRRIESDTSKDEERTRRRFDGAMQYYHRKGKV